MTQPQTPGLDKPVVAEGLGTGLLVAAVVGSGIMGDRLADGNVAVALLANTLATAAALVALILTFGPISGAHFNPVVTLTMLMRRAIDPRMAFAYLPAQFIGAIAGVWLAHAMFAEPLIQVSTKLRGGPAQGLSELVATFGLIGTILATQRHRPEFTPVAVGLFITSAYWFTASTSFANPVVTAARSMSDSFAGIAPASVPIFLAGQLAGLFLGTAFFSWLLATPDQE